MTEKIIIELENTGGCNECLFLNSSDMGEDCDILRGDIQEGDFSNIDFQFSKNWRYENCPLLYQEYLCESCGVKVIRKRGDYL